MRSGTTELTEYVIETLHNLCQVLMPSTIRTCWLSWSKLNQCFRTIDLFPLGQLHYEYLLQSTMSQTYTHTHTSLLSSEWWTCSSLSQKNEHRRSSCRACWSWWRYSCWWGGQAGILIVSQVSALLWATSWSVRWSLINGNVLANDIVLRDRHTVMVCEWIESCMLARPAGVIGQKRMGS